MTTFQAFYLILSLTVFAFAWLRGGHAERAGVAIFVIAYLLSVPASAVTVNGFRAGEAMVDLAFFVVLSRLAAVRDRWWLLAATALAGLMMAAHAVMITTSDLDLARVRADVAARWGIGVLMVLCLAAGVLERWMAGEAPAGGAARWRSRSTDLNI